MINVDLTKVFHPRSFELLTPLLPGLFFECSVLVGKPQLVREVVGRVGSDRYLILFLALLFAFVVGNALLLWVRLIEVVLWKACRLFHARWPRLLQGQMTWAARRRHARLAVGAKPFPRASVYERLVGWASFWTHRNEQQRSHVLSAWWNAVGVALKRVGIDDRGYHMDAWAGVVGGINVNTLRSSLLVMGLHALGWGGLIARRIAPELGTLYRDLSVFLIFMGILSGGSIAWRTTHPVLAWQISLRNVLDELRKAAGAAAVADKIEKDGNAVE
jgi:hypothetical protein